MGKSSRKKSHPPHHAQLPPGQMAMSAALIDLVKPLLYVGISLQEYQMVIAFGAMAWNVALYPREEWKNQLLKLFKALTEINLTFDEIVELGNEEEIQEEPRQGKNLVRIVKALIHRKDQLFPDDLRAVVSATVSRKNDDFQVSAVSAHPDAQSQGHQ